VSDRIPGFRVQGELLPVHPRGPRSGQLVRACQLDSSISLVCRSTLFARPYCQCSSAMLCAREALTPKQLDLAAPHHTANQNKHVMTLCLEKANHIALEYCTTLLQP